MPQVALDQATIDYRVLGPEDSPHPPVLFVHGILVDSRLWDRVAEGLARQGFRCYLPNWPLGSHTIPVKDPGALSPSGVASMIRDFIGALGLSDVTLVGNDTGGGLCQLVIDAYPDQVGRLVLTNCDAFDKFPPFPFTLVFALLRGPISIKLLSEQMRIKALRHSPLGFGLLVHPDAQLTASWLEPCRTDARIRRNVATLLRNVAKTDLTDVSTRLGRFTKPVTIVWGQRDRAFTPALGRRLAALFPNAALIEVPEARTFVSLDAPAAVIDAIATVGATRLALDQRELADVGVAVAEQVRATGQVLHVPVVDLLRTGSRWPRPCGPRAPPPRCPASARSAAAAADASLTSKPALAACSSTVVTFGRSPPGKISSMMNLMNRSSCHGQTAARAP